MWLRSDHLAHIRARSIQSRVSRLQSDRLPSEPHQSSKLCILKCLQRCTTTKPTATCTTSLLSVCSAVLHLLLSQVPFLLCYYCEVPCLLCYYCEVPCLLCYYSEVPCLLCYYSEDPCLLCYYSEDPCLLCYYSEVPCLLCYYSEVPCLLCYYSEVEGESVATVL